MPCLRIETNIELDGGQAQDLAAKATSLVAESLGKSERYVMVMVHQGALVTFDNDQSPAAYCTLGSIGLEESQCPVLAESLCMFLETRTGIPQDRIYIEFKDLSRSMFGWNGKTFA
ncbi:phenylpyruvate tautomerase MIF-related protein [Oceanidesulfovibrio indonesiensis]|nr:phenylpyruvate tautomerase MIF-related protein [Oceanidesulfovibrio indonesiensis]